MAGFQVDIGARQETATPETPPTGRTGKSRILLRVAIGAMLAFLLVGVAVAAAGFLYWRSLVNSPQYTLALIVDAARKGEDDRITEYIDVDAVVEDFVPQITDKAIEMYGKGLPPNIIKQAETVAAPLIPVIKQRARAELPRLLRDKTSKYKNVPFWALVIGADRYLDIETKEDTAVVLGRSGDRQLQLTMKRENGTWKVVAVRDDELAERIASKIGQEIILLAREAGKTRIEDLGRRLGLDGIGDLLKQAEDLLK